MYPFKSQKPLSIWLSEYAISHQNTTNKRIHYICDRRTVVLYTLVLIILYCHAWLLCDVS